MIKLMADSTCDLSQEIVERYNIGIAPLNIEIEGVNYRDKVDITSDDFFKRLPDMEELPKTGAPSPEAYLNIIEEAMTEGYSEFLCICMSSGTSASYQAAEIAREAFYDKYEKTDVKIHVVDSWSMSHGSGWLILKSAQLLEEGYTFEELVAFNETHKKRVKHFLCVEDLHNLTKSGRISNTGALIGSLLRVKPIMSMKDTKGAIVAKARGTKKALNYYVEEFQKRYDPEWTNFIIIGYSNDKSIAHELKEKIKLKTDFLGDMHIMQMGVAVGTHVGLGGLSLFFMEKENM
ncbi:EDD domain protein, DegV family [Alkalibacterium subtropicum]|uniref:EDD domain protein, DegV family n=1 Tax=Alkalibacterium subtropicum TaxID=753702 RepID=A0A1I1JL01_9LACT|nr:DegV family protein [Alkalibacterium subtropicum]SFC49237.1 EDD domain protein, DegV family [Alkalibacterium subtropicum]